jgi:hypothetical protein
MTVVAGQAILFMDVIFYQTSWIPESAFKFDMTLDTGVFLLCLRLRLPFDRAGYDEERRQQHKQKVRNDRQAPAPANIAVLGRKLSWLPVHQFCLVT